MKAKTVFLTVAVPIVALFWAGACWAGNPKSGGLLGGLTGETDPTEERRPSQPTKTADPVEPGPPPAVYSAPDPNRFNERIAYLEGLTPDTAKPVSGLESAEHRLEVLRRRAEQLRKNDTRRVAELVDALSDESQRLEDRWRGVIEAMNDGKERNHLDWANECAHLLGTPHQLELPAKTPVEEAEEVIGLPPKVVTDLEEDPLEEDEEPPADEAESDPMKPVEPPKPPAPPRDFKDLIEAFRKHEKPMMMHPLTWARLQDRFEYDLAEFQFAAAAAMKRLENLRRDELAPVLAALERAQETYANLKTLGDEHGEGLRRHLAYRIYKAELEQLKMARNDLRQIAKERGGQKSNRSFAIRIKPLDPTTTIIDIGRTIELSGGPGAPSADAYDNIDPNGLPPLYPDDSGIIMDEKVHYGNLVKANIERYEGLLRDINRRKANAEALVRRRERKLLRRRATELRRRDRLDGREGHPLNEARNRRVLRQMQQELKASRAEHIAQLRARLEAEAEPIIKRLEAEYKRRDVMQVAERRSEPKTSPNPTASPSEP